MQKIKVVALFGKCAAGKDTIQNWLVATDSNIKKIVSCTTRKPRDYEIDGVDYHFLSTLEFTQKVLDGSMLEAVSFRDNFYGAAIDELDENKINIAVFELNGIHALLDDPRLDVMCIYIDTNDKIRLLRCLKREENPNCLEICQRFIEEDKEFSNFDFDHFVFDNSEEKLYIEFYNLLKAIKDFGQGSLIENNNF
jgi:guanylate kinase